MLQVRRLAALGSVEIDHVQVLRAVLRPPPRSLQRVLVVDGPGGKVALDQAHGLAAEDVDRRVELHDARGTREARRCAMQMLAKLASRRSPAAEDFSGWN